MVIILLIRLMEPQQLPLIRRLIELAIIRIIHIMAIIHIRPIRPLIKVNGLLVFQLPNTLLFPKLFLMEHIRWIYPRRLFPKLFPLERIRRIYPRILKEGIQFNIQLRNSRLLFFLLEHIQFLKNYYFKNTFKLLHIPSKLFHRGGIRFCSILSLGVGCVVRLNWWRLDLLVIIRQLEIILVPIQRLVVARLVVTRLVVIQLLILVITIQH